MHPDSMFSLLQKRQEQTLSPRTIYRAATGSQFFIQRLKLDRRLEVHDGCVNTVCWNEDGTLLLSGSDDQNLVISNPFNGKVLAKIRSGHRSNIFSAKFLPASMDRELVSCSGSGEIFYTDVDREDTYGTNRFDCHFGTTYKIVVVPNEAATFLSCGDDGTVRFFDLRVKTSCTKFNCEEDVVINLRDAVSAMAVDPIIPFQLAVGAADGIVRIYDRRMLKTRESGGSSQSLIGRFQSPSCASEKRHYRITSLNYRPGSHDCLVNYSSENIYLFNTYDVGVTQSYSAQSGLTGETSKTTTELNSTRMSGGCSDSEPSTSGGATAASDNGHDASGTYKPIKRLRLRGDWSDTGPDARPESEDPAPTNLIMQRMSDLLTRMLNSHGSGRSEDGENAPSSTDLPLPESTSRDRLPAPSQATSSDSTAAAVLRSVMLNGTGGRIRPSIRRETTETERYSISSEGLVSPELSSQDYDSTEMAAVQSQAAARDKPEDLVSSSTGILSDGAGVETSLREDGKNDESTHDDSRADESEPEDIRVESKVVRTLEQSDYATSVTACEGIAQYSSTSRVDSDATAINVTRNIDDQSGHKASHEGEDAKEQVGKESVVMSMQQDIQFPKVNDEASPSCAHRDTHQQDNLSSACDQSKCCDLALSSQVQAPMSILCSVSPSNENGCTDTSATTHETNATHPVHNQTALEETNLATATPHKEAHFDLAFSSLAADSGKILRRDSATKAKDYEPVWMPQNEEHCHSSHSLPSVGPDSFCSLTPDNSAHSLMPSSYSEHAIAEGVLTTCYGGTPSQQTLDDISRITSCGTDSLLSERLSGVFSPDFKRSDTASSSSTGSAHMHLLDRESHMPDALLEQDENVPSSFLESEGRWTNISHEEENTLPYSPSSLTETKAENQMERDEDVTVKFDLAESESTNAPKSTTKGKGVGKSSTAKGKSSPQHHYRIYSPYHRGNVKYAEDDDPPDIQMIPDLVVSSGSPGLQDPTSGAPASVNSTETPIGPSKEEPSSQFSSLLATNEDSERLPSQSERGSSQTDAAASAGHPRDETVAMATADVENRPGVSWQESGMSGRPTLSIVSSDDEDDDDAYGHNAVGDSDVRQTTRRESPETNQRGRAATKIQEFFRKMRQSTKMSDRNRTLPEPRVLMKYSGHRNCRTMIKEANFYGENYVMSGSDCGRILMWERLTGRLVAYLEADRHVVNCVQPNPVFPMIASSGIDYDIKIWAPLQEDCQFDEDVAEMIVRRNELMLVETRDTITVPAAFMLRVLASLSQIRTGRNSSGSQGNQEQSGQE